MPPPPLKCRRPSDHCPLVANQLRSSLPPITDDDDDDDATVPALPPSLLSSPIFRFWPRDGSERRLSLLLAPLPPCRARAVGRLRQQFPESGGRNYCT